MGMSPKCHFIVRIFVYVLAHNHARTASDGSGGMLESQHSYHITSPLHSKTEEIKHLQTLLPHL